MSPQRPKMANFTYTGYESPVVGAIRDLPVFVSSSGVIYSVWRPSWRERLKVLFGLPIVVAVLSSKQPPMRVFAGEGAIA